MGRLRRLGAVATVSALSAACVHVAASASHKRYLSPGERLAAIRRAQVWSATNIPSVDIKAGPPRRDGFAPEQTVTCNYVAVQLGGKTPKFACAITPDDVVKVKYGRQNGEVYAEVAATRLLSALGFGADAQYPVHVICRGCPTHLAKADAVESGAVTFEVAAIERKMPGREMETHAESGWAWPELDLVDPRTGGAPEPQRDALKLLAVMLQHSDSKDDQQRLLCVTDKREKEDLAACSEPFMMVHDVGQTFGRANMFNRGSVGSANLQAWASVPIWKDPARCVGNLPQSQTGTLADPTISEAGRAFLANLLGQLTDAQLRDLFEVSRLASRQSSKDVGNDATIEQWVAAFKHKRDEIASITCPF
jgi:hypothetical protein